MTDTTADTISGLADDHMLTRKDVERITSLSRSTLYRLMGRKEFPRGHKLSPNRVGWSVRVIREWLKK